MSTSHTPDDMAELMAENECLRKALSACAAQVCNLHPGADSLIPDWLEVFTDDNLLPLDCVLDARACLENNITF